MRQQAISCGFINRILERLSAVSGEKPREYVEDVVEEEELEELPLAKKQSSFNEEKLFEARTKKKRGGVGYTAVRHGEAKFDVGAYLENKKQRNEQIKVLIDICTGFFNSEEQQAPKEMIEELLESALLPILESAFRNGSILEISKEAETYHSYLELTRALCKQQNLLPCLIEIDKRYKPTQTEPIYKLLGKMNDLATIFLSCLNQQQNLDTDTTIKIKDDFMNFPKKLNDMLSSGLSDTGESKFLKFIMNNTTAVPTGSALDQNPFLSAIDYKGPVSPFLQKQLDTPNITGQNQLLQEDKDKNPFLSALDKHSTDAILSKNKELIAEAKLLFQNPADYAKNSKATVDSLLGASFQMKNPDTFMPLGQTTEKIKAAELMSDSFSSDSIGIANEGGKGDAKSPSINSPTKSPNKPTDIAKSLDSDSDGWETEHIETVNSDIQDEESKGDQLIEESKDGKPMEESKDKQVKEESKINIFETHLKKIESITGQKADETDKQIIDTFKQTQQVIAEIQKIKNQKSLDSAGPISDDENWITDEEASDVSIDEPKPDKQIKVPSKPLSITSPSESKSIISESQSKSSKTQSQKSESLSDGEEMKESYEEESEEEEPSYGSSYGSESNIVKPKPLDDSTVAKTTSGVSEGLSRDICKTYAIVQEAVEELLASQNQSKQIEDALQLPKHEQYRALLSPLRFDYMSMKLEGSQVYKHKYKDNIQSNSTMQPSKMVRLAQELADLSNSLPSEFTNSMFARVDKDRVDTIKAVITGAEGTPYAHGCFEFDIFCDNNYPNDPPKMNLQTTGNGAVRFNPNLYACGKVCLSLLGTWRGQQSENWDAKISTILQVLVSVQSIIMSEEVYFNEPGFEGEAGTVDGERRNEGYSNIVRYGNVKYAMLGQLKNPPKGFETVIKRHFYIKKADVMKTCRGWVERAGKIDALYTALVNDHNHTIAKDFQKSKTKYKEEMTKVVNELEECINKLEKPTNYQIKAKPTSKTKQQQKQKAQDIKEGQVKLDDVDMGTDSEGEDTIMIDTTKPKKQKQVKTGLGQDIDIEDEAVKDRWSRYIGAMGVEAVAKQAAANIFVSGAGALGMEISKNLVLSGCKSFTLHDTVKTTNRDLSGQFFLNASSVGKVRSEECINRLQQLNYYVRCKAAPSVPIPHDHAELEKEPWLFKSMDVIILTEADFATAVAVNEYCRANNKKFILAQLAGVFGRVFNDFGESFEVMDKNGEELIDTIIKSISNDERGLVELLGNQKHKFEDGDEVLISGVEGMKLKEGEKHDDAEVKSDSINDTIHKVLTVSPYSFKIGDTRKFTPYEAKGLAKQMRMKTVLKFKSFQETMLKTAAELPYEMNLAYADCEKLSNNQLSHICFEALDTFKKTFKRSPMPWNLEMANKFFEIAKEIAKRYDEKPEDWKPDGFEKKFIYLFCFQNQGVFGPLAAFYGGFVAQECVKAITQKFSPTYQVFYYDAIEVLPEFSPEKHIATEEQKEFFYKTYLPTIAKTQQVNDRTDGLRICIGSDLLEKLKYTNLFMVGAGAIGCELLKNYAMLGVGTGKPTDKIKTGGQIVLTDPDIIEVSNLNRQFLFREKHLRKPKSQTAAAAAIYMNPDLKGNIIARLDKVCEATNHIFTDKFFEDTTVVTNALDNVQARKYIDIRCVTAKTPLLESGTLGPKGHVQVILPYKTESYGSQQDPEDNTEIPHCTLKMFPEETLHCIEWARDKFGKMFSQMPQSAVKILDEGKSLNPVAQQDIIALKEGLKLLRKRPKNFSDCIEYSRMRFEKLFNHDIKQLLHVYPLDAKTKDGNLFWSLPKRPPVPVDFDKENMLHCTFITSMACLRATIFFLEIPSKKPRSDDFRLNCGEMASQIKPEPFVPNDEKAKEIQASVEKEAAKKDEEEKKEEAEETKAIEQEELDDISKLKEEFLKIYSQLEEMKQVGKQEWIEKNFIKSEEFEKDNDANYHIDFMYSMGNCRSTCYKLEPMDWITVKLKAGRIVPALATTTAAVSGMQTLELVKVLKDCKKEDFRNIFLNLAVPIMQASEPGDLLKEKLLEGVEVTLWDRWEVKDAKSMTLLDFMTHLETKYNGLEIRDVMKGNQPIFFHAIMTAQGKEQEKKKVLETSLKKLCEADEAYIDLQITCVRKDDAEAQILKGVPPVRVFF